MATAEEVLSGNSPLIEGSIKDGLWVYLGDYLTYDQVALEYFTERMGTVEGLELGLRALCPDGAVALSRHRQSFFFMPHLLRLDEQTATVLGEKAFRQHRIRSFGVKEPLTPAAALAVVGGLSPLPENCCDSPLDLSLPSVSEGVAQALRVQAHEFYLHVREEALSPGAAEALAHHAGYYLTLFLAKELSADAIVALRSNPAKRVSYEPTKRPGIAYTVRLAATSPGRDVGQ